MIHEKYKYPRYVKELQQNLKTKVQGDELLIQDCPFCGNKNYNFQINYFKNVYHCWKCGEGGGPHKLRKLLKELSCSTKFSKCKNIILKLKDNGNLNLPDNKYLIRNDSRSAEIAKNKLYSRGVTDKIIEEWSLRIATGNDQKRYGFDYFGYIIAPFYGLNGLEYYIAIGYIEEKMKYKFPKSEEATKDKWVPKRRGSDSIIIVEGFFDGTSIWKYTDLDVLILFGKFILPKQVEMLSKVNFEKVYICLDGEELEASKMLSEKLSAKGINVYMVTLPYKKDPNDLGNEINKYIENTEKYI